MKKTLITLSLLIGLILATQAQLNIGLPQTLTYDNAPDSIKASLFNTDGEAMPFDSLYITTGTPWTETVNFYHSSRGADISTGLNASYVFTGTPTAANAVGKRPKAEGTRGPKCNFNDLNTFETTNDGFLYDNKRTEETELYYGWHVIKKTVQMTGTYKQNQVINRSGLGIPIISPHKYSLGNITSLGYELTSATYYSYEGLTGTNYTTPEYLSNAKPINTNNAYTKEQWHSFVDDEQFVPSSVTANETSYNNSPITQTKTWTGSYVDYIYVWASATEIQNGLGIDLGTTITFDESTQAINGTIRPTEGISVTQTTTLYDIVGQVRHHFTVGTPNSATYGTCHYNYYDTTWYNLAYSYNGQRYNSSDPSASYHEYDTNYETTGEITKIVNGESKSEYYSTIINKKPAVAMLVYARNGNQFDYVRTANPLAERAGRITDKSIYIHAYVDNLHWNSGDYLGWMQPVNCDIYLDNVRLRTARDITLNRLFNKKIEIDYPSINNENFSINNSLQASVFFLPEGNTTIHTRGNNYLAGNLAQYLHVKLTVEVSAFDVAALLTREIFTYIPNYSAPITIKGAYLFDEQPEIKCLFDSQWADETNTNGYLDLSTRTYQHDDSTGLIKETPQDIITNSYKVTSSQREARITRTNHKGYRYASPLNTGGQNGSFIINGGHINLWPANGHAANVELNSYGKKNVPVLGDQEIYVSIIGGKYANYLVCGNSEWNLTCNGSTFDRSGESQLFSTDNTLVPTQLPLGIDIGSLMDKHPSSATLHGAGSGIPEGHLIINGGTISANTDPNSFAYNWTDYDIVQKKAIKKTAYNVADDGSGQPLFGPNVVINGGTFLHPLYGTTNHGTGSALNKEEYTRDELNPISQWQKNGINDYDVNNYRAKNLHGDDVYREDYALPDVDTDYTTFNDEILSDNNIHDPESRKDEKAVIGNIGLEGKEYYYGMTNVRSDANGLGYFYLPEKSGIVKNYYVRSNEKLNEFTQTTQGEITTTYQPYHLWVDKGGEITVAENFWVGRPYFRSTHTEDVYQTIAMPFTAKRFFVTDPWDDQFQFYSYVEIDDANAAGVPEADRIAINSNAYCYLYFLDDEATNSAEDANIVPDQRATGVNNTFRSYYHTHTDGSTMQAGKTYVIKFPKVDDANYWETNIVTLQGTKGQLIPGKGTFSLATRPAATPNDTENPTFIMDGNTTFATQDISGKGEVYLVDPAQWGDDAFHATTVSTLAPMQGYLVGSTTTMQRYRIIGREGKVEQTALDQLIHTGWTAVGAHQAILIMTPQDATAHIYTAEGKLWKTVSLTANTGVIIDAPAGFYIVHAGNDSKKVLVQ